MNMSDHAPSWSKVERRISAYLAATGMVFPACEVQAIVAKLRSRHGELPFEAAMRLALINVQEGADKAVCEPLVQGSAVPQLSPCKICVQSIEPWVSDARLRAVSSACSSIIQPKRAA